MAHVILLHINDAIVCNVRVHRFLWLLLAIKLALDACTAGFTVVVLCVTTVTATYLVFEYEVWYYKLPYGIPNASIVWISLKMLCSPAVASLADTKLLDFFPSVIRVKS
jgi:hypothetical protein